MSQNRKDSVFSPARTIDINLRSNSITSPGLSGLKMRRHTMMSPQPGEQSTNSALQHANTQNLPAIKNQSRAQSVIRNNSSLEKLPNVRMAFRKDRSKPIVFGESYAPEYLKEQAKLELEYSKMPTFDRNVPLQR